MNTASIQTNICCPEFNTARWDEKIQVWENKLFISDSIPEIFHIPFPKTFEKAVGTLWETAQEAKADPPADDFLLLCYDPSPWKNVLFLSVTKEVPLANNVKLSGTFISKVFDGPYSGVPKYIREMDDFLRGYSTRAKQYYFHYAYCPKCAKKYGHNYIVAFAEIED